jgi:formylglycine-generating enzyme required for sulfatase activity
MKKILLLSVLLLFFSAVSVVAADKSITAKAKTAGISQTAPRRLALVVGNSAYRYSGALANPARDAELMAKTLKGVGFKLVGDGAQTDLSYVSFNQVVEAFGDMLHEGDVALFYYSGHGLQVAGENYLVPVDADIKKEAEVRVKAVPVNLLFAKLDGIPKAVNIVILDACRNNPFARSFRSAGGGLASMNAPSGTLVAFSTAPGQVAEDGSGSNSAYTAALAKQIQEPGLLVEQVFKRVRSEVGSATKGTQTPWENTSLTGSFKFIDGDALSLKKAALAKAGDAKKGELEALLRMEEEAALQKKREQIELEHKAAELARLDAQISEMKMRLGSGTASGNDSLKAMVAMVQKREGQVKQLELLRQQRESEELKRQQEIEQLKVAAKEKRRAAVDADIADYQTVADSPYGKDLVDAAWQSLVGNYPIAAEVSKGDVATLRKAVVEGKSLVELVSGELVAVPGGCFQMGDAFGEGSSNETPVHEVCLNSFFIGKTEVTQAQWRQVMGGNPSYFFDCGDDCPVEKVSWNDVQNYLKKLNTLTGKNFRLPTEAEWEYAARSGGKQSKYAGGDNVDAVAWYAKNSSKKTHPVGQKEPNGLGLYDMGGNVWEWCQDWYDPDYYGQSPRNDPQGGASGSFRVNRGGSWGGADVNARTTSRYRNEPRDRYDDLGFRLVLTSGQ